MKTTTLWACLLLLVSVSFANNTHKVREGENDHTIARKYGVSVKELHQANGTVKWEKLQIGQSLRVPGQPKSSSKSSPAKSTVKAPRANSSHIVANGESDWSIARKYKLTVAQLQAMNPGVSFKPLKLGAKLKVYKPIVAKAPAAKSVAKPTSRPVMQVTTAAARPSTTKPVVGQITTMNAEVNGKDVALRSAAAGTAGKIITLNPGIVGRVVDRQAEWYKLMFSGGTTGWVSGKLLKNSEKAITPLPTAPARTVARSAPKNVSALGGSQTSAGKDLIATALAQQGVRYRWGGTSRGGFDCSGFVQYTFRQHGVSLPRTAREQATRGTSISKGSLRAGDLVFFVTRGSYISHVGIYIGNNRFVHASSGGGRVRINQLSEGYYSKRYAGAKRVSGKFVANTFQEDFDRYARTLPVEEVPEGVDPEPESVISENRGTDAVTP